VALAEPPPLQEGVEGLVRLLDLRRGQSSLGAKR